MMVGSRRSEEVVDPNIEVRPSTRALKRSLLTALRCVDPDSEKRPKMSQVVRMLESEEYPIVREVKFSNSNLHKLIRTILMNSCFYFLLSSIILWSITSFYSLHLTYGCLYSALSNWAFAEDFVLLNLYETHPFSGSKTPKNSGRHQYGDWIPERKFWHRPEWLSGFKVGEQADITGTNKSFFRIGGI